MYICSYLFAVKNSTERLLIVEDGSDLNMLNKDYYLDRSVDHFAVFDPSSADSGTKL